MSPTHVPPSTSPTVPWLQLLMLCAGGLGAACGNTAGQASTTPEVQVTSAAPGAAAKIAAGPTAAANPQPAAGATAPAPAAAAAAAPVAPADTARFGCTPPAGTVTEASLWKPRVKPFSYWTNLSPWAFWAVDAMRPRVVVELGSHNGFSFFSFAQAIAELDLPTRAYAVDTWQGDVHAGEYGEEVFQGFLACNAPYSAFATPLRMTFDDARQHIEDGSVDLLHIDGRHFYEDVDHDFSTWLPKLSDRAVVLFHDIDVQGSGFGVYRWWDEIVQKYPHFAFHQEAGLGILGVGRNLPAGFQTLFALSGEDARCVQHIYAELGHQTNAWEAPQSCAAGDD